jgi:uncharacterized protein YdbL (DUF1318 family)
MRSQWRQLTIWIVGTLLAGCVPVTINITFPQEKIDSAASRIEDMVRSPAPTAPQKKEDGKPQGSLPERLLIDVVAPAQAEAQSRSVEVVPELKARTPEIMKAIESRKNRFPQLQVLAQKGCVGENNQGLIEPRPGAGCDASAVSSIVAAENRDREYIYETLRTQNNMPPSDLPRIRAGFARANRDKAGPGEWVQQPSGEWVKK